MVICLKSFPALLAAILLFGCQFRDGRTDCGDPMRSAYRRVLADWAPAEDGARRRGYNIAAVLVAPDGKIVAGELNSVMETRDCTQHAEMRLIQNYLRRERCFNLNGYTVYTTLEPCAMCAATMSMAGIGKVYYGQSDPSFGKAAERLALDSSRENGYPPYPRAVRAELLRSPMQEELERKFESSGMREITRWLATDEAKQIMSGHLR